MPDFATTRTPGSNTSNYGLADHIADGHAHDQYLRIEDYLGGSAGLPTSGEMLLHKQDPDAHGVTYVKSATLSNYALKTDLNAYTPISIMDDYVKWDDLPNREVITLSDNYKQSDSNVAASLAAANGVYIELQTHRSTFAQGDVTDHKDSTGYELYAHRTHMHAPSEIGAAPEVHDHDDRYSLLDHLHDGLYAPIMHSHDYLDISALSEVGIYPEATKFDGTINPDYNSVATFDDLSNLLAEDISDGVYYQTIDTGLWYQASVIPGTEEDSDPIVTWTEVTDPGIEELLPIDFNDQLIQGNTGIPAEFMDTALNGPEFSTPPVGISILTVIETTLSGKDEEVARVVAITQTLTTSAGVYFRIGEGVYDEDSSSMQYVFESWNSAVNDLAIHKADLVLHVTAAERSNWNSKATPAYVDMGISTHNTAESAHSALFNTKMTNPTGGSAGQVLTKTTTGFNWADPSLPVSTWFTYTYEPSLELVVAAGNQQKIVLDGDLNIPINPQLSASQPTFLLEIDCGATERTVTIGVVTVLNAKTGIWHIGWVWNGTTTRRYPPVEVS